MMELKEKVHSREWDTLIVLDACRYDYFKHLYQLYPNLNNGDLKKVRSPASMTRNVLPEIFDEEFNAELHTANVTLLDEKLRDEWDPLDYFDVVNRIEPVKTNSSNSLYTPMPSVRKPPCPTREWEYVMENLENINGGRHIMWFIQPHYPYYGDVAVNHQAHTFPYKIITDSNGEIKDTFVRLLRLAYKSNVEEALYLACLVSGELDGDTVITSDHGEMLFDKGVKDDFDPRHRFGHPEAKVDCLRDVPWLMVPEESKQSVKNLDIEEFVKKAYNIVLDRSADEEGFSNYVETLKSHISNGVLNVPPSGYHSLLKALSHSDEYTERFGDICSICELEEQSIDIYESDIEKQPDSINSELAARLQALGYDT